MKKTSRHSRECLAMIIYISHIRNWCRIKQDMQKSGSIDTFGWGWDANPKVKDGKEI